MRGLQFLSLCAKTALALLLGATWARAEMLPFFDLDECTAEAKLIVQGRIDQRGNLEIAEVLKGERPQKMALAPTNAYQWLSASMGTTGPIEVLAFAKAEDKGVWNPVWGYAGVVGLHEQGVYVFDEQSAWSRGSSVPVATRDKHYDRKAFLELVRQAIEVSNQRDAMLALPRGGDRANRLIKFALAHCTRGSDPTVRSSGQSHLGRITRGLRPADPEEQQAILRFIATSDDAAAKALIVALAGDIPLAPAAFDDLAPLVDLRYPHELRRAAMEAIARIDGARATDRLLPLLTLKERELDAALTALARTDWPRPGSALYMPQLEALLALLDEVPLHYADYPRLDWLRVNQELRNLLNEYAHPRLVAALSGWISDGTRPGKEYAIEYLNGILATHWTQQQLVHWWEQHHAAMEARYDLSTQDGRLLWFTAYQDHDAQTRLLLMQLWRFEPKPDETALIKAAQEQDTADDAKLVLAKLWKTEQLSNDGRKKVFETFLQITFTEEPAMPDRPYGRELRVRGIASFPFSTPLWYRSSIAINGEPKWPPESEGQVVLEPQHMVYNLGGLGMSFGGQPKAKAILEIRQIDYYHGRTEMWRIERPLGPIQLRDTGP